MRKTFQKKEILNHRHNPGIGDHIKIASKTSKRSESLGNISISAELLEKARIQFGENNVRVTVDKKTA